MRDWIEDLCAHVGIAATYRGYEGQTVTVETGTRLKVLRALGLEVHTPDDARDVLQRLQAEEEARPLPPEIIVRATVPSVTPLKGAVQWQLFAEDSERVLASGAADAFLNLPALPLGIHRLEARSRAITTTSWVISRPERAWTLADHLDTPRIWGVQTALYGLTDGAEANLGTYDLLGAYAAAMAPYGPDFVGINPIHAMGQTRPGDVISPYSPSHRGFVNPWHCAQTGPAETDLVDYQGALEAGEAEMDAQFAAFRDLPANAPETVAFEAFVAEVGRALEDFAVFEALALRFGPDWRTWPAAYRDPASKEVQSFAQTQAWAISRTKWAQWRAQTDLAHAQARATGAGMRLGLFLDLAVGPRLGGAETWARDSALVTSAALGAPPDPLGPSGQNWGLAPFSPLKLRAQGYSSFARLLRTVMQNAGMVRIDHILGLMRSYWIPEGTTQGAYVDYPLDVLLAIVAIESQRCKTSVVGEDLGLVPEGLRDKLTALEIYGLDVLQFMRTEEGGFTNTKDARSKAVCTFATHDTPTITGFFAAEDGRQRASFGALDADGMDAMQQDRDAARATLEPGGSVEAIHARLARSRSEMVAVQLDDIAARISQQNLPGTVDEYPNWRLRAPFKLAQIAGSKTFETLGAEMAAQGRSNPVRRKTDDELQDMSHLTH